MISNDDRVYWQTSLYWPDNSEMRLWVAASRVIRKKGGGWTLMEAIKAWDWGDDRWVEDISLRGKTHNEKGLYHFYPTARLALLDRVHFLVSYPPEDIDIGCHDGRLTLAGRVRDLVDVLLLPIPNRDSLKPEEVIP